MNVSKRTYNITKINIYIRISIKTSYLTRPAPPAVAAIGYKFIIGKASTPCARGG